MVIYTKRGDKGETSLYDSQNAQSKRVSKSSEIINAIGSVDELNSYLGVLASEIKNDEFKSKILDIQRDLFTIGSILAGAKLEINSSRVVEFESEIDEIEGKLPVLTGFILPGGTVIAARLHFARTLTRRAERALIGVKGPNIHPEVLKYVNRLSDYFFMLARFTNYKQGEKEIKWKE